MNDKPRSRKSSHSVPNGACVEVAALPWRKSSHSLGNTTCIEVAATKPRRVA